MTGFVVWALEAGKWGCLLWNGRIRAGRWLSLIDLDDRFACLFFRLELEGGRKLSDTEVTMIYTHRRTLAFCCLTRLSPDPEAF